MNRESLLEYFNQHYLSRRDMVPRLPLGANPDEFWQEIQSRRRARSTQLPIHGAKGVPCWFVTTDKMIRASEAVVEELMAEDNAEIYSGTAHRGTPALAPLEEVFYTSYVEGSPMMMKAAMEFLQSGRDPGDVEEQMIVNNRSALNFAASNLYHPLDEEFIKMLVMILTQNMEGGGQEYRSDDWAEIPSMMGEPYDLPAAAAVPDRAKEIIAYLADPSVHPLIKAAVAQAWTLIIRPFSEGNERLARLLSNVILSRAGYAFFGEVSLSSLIAKNGFPYYGAAANIMRDENSGDLTYFLEYYMILLSQAVEERRKRKQLVVEEAQAAEQRLARTALAPATAAPRAPDSQAQEQRRDLIAESLAADGYVSVLDDGDADTLFDAGATGETPEGETETPGGGENLWSGERKTREKLLELMNSSGSLIPVAAKIMLGYLDRRQYVFSTEQLKNETGFKGKQTLNLIYSLREKGIIESIGRAETNASYMFCCGQLSDDDYTQETFRALRELSEGTQSLKDKRIAAAIRKCLPVGFITALDYQQAGDGSRWAEDMKLAEQMGFVRRVTRDRYIILRDARPCFDRLDSSQKKRARLMYDSFGEQTFSLDMVVATLDYSSSTASAYLHQFTLLRILDCHKEDVNIYQFLVNPREHPEVFEDAA